MTGRRHVAAWLAAGCLLGLAAGPGSAESLREAVRAAVTSNPSQRAATAEMQAAALGLLELRREYTPRLTLTASAGAERVDNPSSLSAADNATTKLARQVGLSAEYVLFDGYRRANLVYGGAARLDGAIYRLLDASDAMALSAVQAYADVVRHAQLVGIARENVETHRRYERQVRSAVDGGTLPASDGFTVADRVLAAELALTEVEKALADAQARYQTVMGHPATSPMSLPPPSGLPRSRDALVRAALANHPQIALAEARVAQRESEAAVDRAATRPRVTLNAEASAGGDLAGSSGNENRLFLGARMSWTLFEGGRAERAGSFDARTAQAEAGREAAAREVREIALRAWTAQDSAIETVALLRRQERANARIAEQQRLEFEAGERTLLDLLEAERALFNVRFQRISAEAGLVYAQYGVLAAQSGLAAHFGVGMSGVALLPGYADRAEADPRGTVFDTRIAPLE